MGTALLPDGSIMDYREYIRSHPRWQKVRQARLKFDDYQCVVCHRDVRDDYETHHINYNRLGSEHLTDVITLCPKHHAIFHNNFQKAQFWKGKEPEHWAAFSIDHTARLCATYWREDRLICKDPDAPNMCNLDIARGYIDRYMKDFQIMDSVAVDPNDINLFVRNKRYELFFEAEGRGLTVEEFLDEYYGPKVRGKNPIRQEAGKKGSCFDHEPKSFHKHYKENKNLNTLMEVVKQYEQAE